MRHSLKILENQSAPPNLLPSTEQLLLSGGDARIAIDPTTGLNKYGCQPFPDPQLLAFGSSTASVVSQEGFAVADQLRQNLLNAVSTKSHQTVYAEEIQRIRLEWLTLCELSDIPGLELIVSPSGTDLHNIAAQYTSSDVSTPALAIMVEANETGSGVASALKNKAIEVAQIPIRLEDGSPRPIAEIDADAEHLVSKAVASGRRVLLILVDQSKTGMIAPSPACVMALHRRFPDNIEVLVDACQFRISVPTLRAYLEQGFMVALTGSKFLAAPSFSAVLLLPPTIAKRLQQRAFPSGLLPSTSRANWPRHWIGAQDMDNAANFGLLLRCEVALSELRRFRAVPEAAIVNFLSTFTQAIQQRLIDDAHFEPLSVPSLNRHPLITTNSWDQYRTIFPFLLYRCETGARIPLSREESLCVYQQLPVISKHPVNDIAVVRCQLGQPVACGTREGIAVSALRLCISSRLIIEATTRDDKGETIIKDALKALDKVTLLIQH